MKKYRFFYHYYKQHKCMSVHFRGKCWKTLNIICNAPCETKYNKRQPYLVMQGFTTGIEVDLNTNTITIQGHESHDVLYNTAPEQHCD